ncbi:MAG: T9SS type A sorting domain-containing protein [Flavobacteriales bacterium]|nr:T9SS type A sorting domain-containing protein [Flavobacteriales bacterium]
MSKKTILTLALAFVGTFAMAQNQFMTWSHNGGHTPSQYLTVDCNEPFEFHNVGFQTHPVAEGGFGPSTDPNFWPSQNLTLTPAMGASNPMIVTIPTAGTYNFKCGSNPTKQALWGQIMVTGPGCEGATSVEVIESDKFTIYPNPATDVLTIEGLNGAAVVFDVNGKKVMNVMSGTFDISTLSNGTYIVKAESFTTNFIKE